MRDSILLNTKTKEEDKVVCEECGKGVYVPANPSAETNHFFTCSVCGAVANIEANVIVK